jgi:RHS repeat-associated protein
VQAVDGVSGETISYQYDVLKRLTQASSTPTSGSTPAAWTQGYTYDGFGNLTGKGSTAIPVNSATNQLMNSTGVLSNVSYDANGNLLSVTNAGASGLTMTYDEANRVASATVGSSGTEYYGYDPSNHRIYKRAANGAEEWTLYGARGEKLGTFGWWQQCTDPDDPTDCWWEVYTKTTNIWFGGKLLWSGTGATNTSGPDFTDRLGTNRANGARFYPYGDEITSTGNDRVKFATYTRSSFTGLDYADQRYYASMYGRFTTADPYSQSANPKSPTTWNKYVYTMGDPVNHRDHRGLIVDCADGDDDEPCGFSCDDFLGDGLFDASCAYSGDVGGSTDNDNSGGSAPQPDCNAITQAVGFQGLTYKNALEIWNDGSLSSYSTDSTARYGRGYGRSDVARRVQLFAQSD